MQGYVYDNLQRTLDEYPKCLDEPGITVDFNSLLTEMFRTLEVRCEVQKFKMKFTNQFVMLSFDWLLSNV